MTAPRPLAVLAVDDEPPALDELAYLLRADPRVGEVLTAHDAVSALQVLESRALDAVFLDIRMPGLDGLGLARVLARFADPPRVVFVTAYDDAAVDAFALHATDYLLKPLRADRLAEAVRRVQEAGAATGEGAAVDGTGDDDSSEGAGAPGPAGPAPAGGTAAAQETVPVELGGRTRFVPLGEVRYVEASGDYARLHTASGSHLVRAPMAALEERWAAAGFVRVHRSYLVATAHIEELRVDAGGGSAVVVGGVALPVSRRHARELKDRLVRRARRQAR